VSNNTSLFTLTILKNLTSDINMPEKLSEEIEKKKI